LVSRKDVFDGAEVVELEALGLAQGVLEVALGLVGCDVEEGSGDGGRRDSSVRGGVLGIEGMRAVQADPRGACSRRGGRDVGPGRVVAEQAPVDGRARVAQDGAGPARQDRREVPPLAGERGAADGVDAAVDPAQAADARPMLHGAEREAEAAQLRERDHPPLPVSELGEGLIDARAVLRSHVDP
jgi:hypothetical protein